MDNRLISIQSEGRKAFDLAFELFLNNETATHYLDDPKKGLILFWGADVSHTYVKFPIPLNAKQAADLAWAWLSSKKDDEYLDWCDHDGSDGHGFKVYNEEWNKVGGMSYSILAVQPVWAWYGK